jgi:hypothetical protein
MIEEYEGGGQAERSTEFKEGIGRLGQFKLMSLCLLLVIIYPIVFIKRYFV